MNDEHGTYRVDEEPVLGHNGSREEEGRTVVSLSEEVRSKVGNPLENGETGARLQHEHRNGLLAEKSNNDRGPFKV